MPEWREIMKSFPVYDNWYQKWRYWGSKHLLLGYESWKFKYL